MAQPFWDAAYGLGLVGGWSLLTWACMRKGPEPLVDAPILVVHASQTGHASELATALKSRIEQAGEACQLIEADALTPERIEAAQRLFFVVSTQGIGQAPDNGHRFDRALLEDAPDLSGKQLAILALGDRHYPDFCAFGQRIAAWARRGAADFLFPLVEVDDLAVADLQNWDRHLAQIGYPAVGDVAAPQGMAWQVVARQRVAAPTPTSQTGHASDGLFRLELMPAQGAMPAWEIGDLFELTTPDGHLRDYSIASLPHEPHLLLYVRRAVYQGVAGLGSGHLTDAEAGKTQIIGRIRSHRLFRPALGDGPLLAIGAGSGWAGLRPHVLHALQAGQKVHLLYGERGGVDDAPILQELLQWQASERLLQVTFALSKAGGASQAQGGLYVQHLLAQQGAVLREFLGTTGRVVLCGGLSMGEACLHVLGKVMGGAWLDMAQQTGRLRKDLY